jgi:small subunit ribosomal protein S21
MGKYLTIKVYRNDVDKALKIMKKKIQNDGLFKRLKEKRAYEKPCQKRRRKHQEALKRQRRLKK